MNKQQIEANCNLIKSELEREVNALNISEVQDKLMKLTTYTGLSAEILKHSKGMVLYAQKDIVSKESNGKLTPAILKLKIEGELWEELALLTYCERINAAITHACDSLRTVISLYKEEMRNTLANN